VKRQRGVLHRCAIAEGEQGGERITDGGAISSGGNCPIIAQADGYARL
jgi:hypothetical protein